MPSSQLSSDSMRNVWQSEYQLSALFGRCRAAGRRGLVVLDGPFRVMNSPLDCVRCWSVMPQIAEIIARFYEFTT